MSKIKSEANYPILLSKLTFEHFSEYLTTRRNNTGGMLSNAHYGGIRSALMDIYRVADYEMDDQFRTKLGILIGGMKRTATQKRVEEGTVLDEGKKPMSKEAYELIAKYLFCSDKHEHIFAHGFFCARLVSNETCRKLCECKN